MAKGTSPTREVDHGTDTVVSDADTVAGGGTLEGVFGTPPRSAVAEVSAAPSEPAAVDATRSPLDQTSFGARYRVKDAIGEGGMGEVKLTKDLRIGREVAMKVIRRGHGSSSDLRARFEREARVQGQLEHPSVVPVYDLGVTPEGSAYFTMKRIRGMTLEEILAKLRSGDVGAASTYSRRRLLTAFSSVCLAVAFAHTRGVVHRDLKPANVMLGEFGEVNVLDWGVAKITGADEVVGPDLAEAPGIGAIATQHGTILGTPGFMAPEQARGEAVDPRADIYSLGCILFEILTLEPLVAAGTPQAMLAKTLEGADARPSARAPDRGVSPELEAICVRATASDPADRYQSARQMHEAIERYLDGARDESRRRELSTRHTVNAQVNLAQARLGGEGAVRRRALGIREISKALALDPDNENARATMIRLLTETPAEMPPEARAELEAKRRAERSQAAKASALAFAAAFLIDPLVSWLGIRAHSWLVVSGVGLLLVAGYSWWVGAKGRVTRPRMLVAAVLASFTVGSTSAFFGPLILVPSFSLAICLAFVVNLRADRRQRWIFAGLSMLAIAVPLLLQVSGLAPRSYFFEGGKLVIEPWAVHFPQVPTIVFLFGATVLTLWVSTWLVGRSIDALTAAEERQHAQAWNLRQLLPEEAQTAATSSAPAPEPLCGVDEILARSKLLARPK